MLITYWSIQYFSGSEMRYNEPIYIDNFEVTPWVGYIWTPILMQWFLTKSPDSSPELGYLETID